MKEVHLFYAPQIEISPLLPADEASHAIRVLRLRQGDPLLVTNGKGLCFDCRIASLSGKSCEVEIIKELKVERTWLSGIHIAIAPTKQMERMEWMTEKATELGVDSITFIESKNSERRVIKTERIEKTAVAAMKQSHKAVKPIISDMIKMNELISTPFEGQKFIAHCYDFDSAEKGTSLHSHISSAKPFLFDLIAPNRDSLVLIGPEGDFSIDEVKQAEAMGFKSVSLGNNRLRTETAALSAIMMMQIKKANIHATSL